MLESTFLYKNLLLYEKYSDINNSLNKNFVNNIDFSYFDVQPIRIQNVLLSNFTIYIKENYESSDDELEFYEKFPKPLLTRKLKNHYKPIQRKHFLFHYYQNLLFENFSFNFFYTFYKEDYKVFFCKIEKPISQYFISELLKDCIISFISDLSDFSALMYHEDLADIPSVKTFDNKFIRRQYFSTVLIEKPYTPSRIVKGIRTKFRKSLVNVYEYYYNFSFSDVYVYSLLRITKKSFYLQNIIDKINLKNFLHSIYNFNDNNILLLIDKVNEFIQFVKNYNYLIDLNFKKLKESKLTIEDTKLLKKEIRILNLDLLNCTSKLKEINRLKNFYIEKEIKLKKEIKKVELKNYRILVRLKNRNRRKSKRYLDSYEENCHHPFNDVYNLFLNEIIFLTNISFSLKINDIFNKIVITYSSDEECI